MPTATLVYTCPDCGASCAPSDLVYPVGNITMLVCPHCGVIQESEEARRQVAALFNNYEEE
jgi:predicted RNA-binding Zn-ribbon protein involved in translation (DUF1610 family)